MTGTVDAHRLRKMRDLLAFEKLATWRRMNVSIELWKARKIGFMVIVRFHLRRNNTCRYFEVRFAKVEGRNLDAC